MYKILKKCRFGRKLWILLKRSFILLIIYLKKKTMVLLHKLEDLDSVSHQILALLNPALLG